MKFLFWVLAGIVFYTYVGYGLLLYIILFFRKRNKGFGLDDIPAVLPRVAHIVAAYNEEDFIARKIRNSLEMNYPPDRFRLIIVADGSSDNTPELSRQFPGVEVLYQPERKGKVAAMNRAVLNTGDAEILIFSDANTLLNPEAFMLIVRRYQDSSVGGVSGEKKVLSDGMVPGKGEGLYWRYESLLKKLDSDFYSVVGAAGELFSVRKALFEPVPENIILDDFFISLNICKRGYVVKYEPDAYASEAPSSSLVEERKRKVRISAGAFQSMVLLKELLNFGRYGKLSFQYFSHRVLRWAFCPFALPLIFIINGLIAWNEGGSLYTTLFIGQVLFYGLALGGWILAGKKSGTSKIFFVPYYFVFMNVSVWGGLSRYLKGGQSAVWEKARREVPV